MRARRTVRPPKPESKTPMMGDALKEGAKDCEAAEAGIEDADGGG